MTTYSIPRNILRACLHCAGVKDIRPYLNGVKVELWPTGEGRAVGANGAMLGMGRFTLPADEWPAELIEIIIPRNAAKTVKAVGRATPHCVTLTRVDATRWTLGDVVFSPLEGRFPDARRVMVTTPVSGIASQFNPDYIAAFAAASLEFGKTAHVAIAHHRVINRGDLADYDGAAVVSIGRDDWTGVLMPLRSDNVPDNSPAWAREYPPTVKAVEPEPEQVPA